MTEPAADLAPDPAVDWTRPGSHGTPAEALARIQALCRGQAEPYGAMLVVLATHQAVRREHLATALGRVKD